jgi:hypothetical protein
MIVIYDLSPNLIETKIGLKKKKKIHNLNLQVSMRNVGKIKKNDRFFMS